MDVIFPHKTGDLEMASGANLDVISAAIYLAKFRFWLKAIGDFTCVCFWAVSQVTCQKTNDVNFTFCQRRWPNVNVCPWFCCRVSEAHRVTQSDTFPRASLPGQSICLWRTWRLLVAGEQCSSELAEPFYITKDMANASTWRQRTKNTLLCQSCCSSQQSNIFSF